MPLTIATPPKKCHRRLPNELLSELVDWLPMAQFVGSPTKPSSCCGGSKMGRASVQCMVRNVALNVYLGRMYRKYETVSQKMADDAFKEDIKEVLKKHEGTTNANKMVEILKSLALEKESNLVDKLTSNSELTSSQHGSHGSGSGILNPESLMQLHGESGGLSVPQSSIEREVYEDSPVDEVVNMRSGAMDMDLSLSATPSPPQDLSLSSTPSPPQEASAHSSAGAMDMDLSLSATPSPKAGERLASLHSSSGSSAADQTSRLSGLSLGSSASNCAQMGVMSPFNTHSPDNKDIGSSEEAKSPGAVEEGVVSDLSCVVKQNSGHDGDADQPMLVISLHDPEGADGGTTMIKHVPMHKAHQINFHFFRDLFRISSTDNRKFCFKMPCEDGTAPYQWLMVTDYTNFYDVLPMFGGSIIAECRPVQSDSE